MNFLMYSKIWLLGKWFPTFATFIGPFSCMSYLMSKEMRLLDEGFATFNTSIRFLSCMNSLMGDKHRTVAKGFATYNALIWFLSCMKFRVFIKGWAIPECFPTFPAHKTRPFSVDTPVLNKCVFRAEGFLAISGGMISAWWSWSVLGDCIQLLHSISGLQMSHAGQNFPRSKRLPWHMESGALKR